MVYPILQKIVRATRVSFRERMTLFVGVLTFLAVLLIAILGPNMLMFREMSGLEMFGFLGTVKVTWNLLDYFFSGYTQGNQLLILTLALLTALNASLFATYFKKRSRENRVSGIGFVGTAVGMIGIGCTSCGSIILSSLLGMSAASGFLGVLPFQGLEFGILGVILIAASIALLSDKVLGIESCRVYVSDGEGVSDQKRILR
jgi:hypothetical protein